MKNSTLENQSVFQWWNSRRLHYNYGLVKAGIGAFVCYVIVFQIFKDKMSIDDEISWFTILFQGVAYLVAMGIANLFFFIGPISEKLIKPKQSTRYRKATYNAGYWFSVSLPFLIPVMVLIMAITS